MPGCDLNDDDVVSMPNLEAFGAGEMFKFAQLKQAIKNFFQGDSRHVNPRTNWLKDGVLCEVLRVKGDGWQKGKLRLYMEFIPDDPEAFGLTHLDVAPEKSPLDDLRSNLEV